MISSVIVLDTTFVSSYGAVFERAITNAQCCETHSITASEDGKHVRWPVVSIPYGSEDDSLTCGGGRNLTFQERIDQLSEYYFTSGIKGICVEGWRYVKRGNWIKQSPCKNNNLEFFQ